MTREGKQDEQEERYDKWKNNEKIMSFRMQFHLHIPEMRNRGFYYKKHHLIFLNVLLY